MKSGGIPNLNNATYIESGMMLSNTFDQSKAKAKSYPYFFASALSIKRRAMNNALFTDGLSRKPNCVEEKESPTWARLSRLSRIEAKSL